MQNKLTLVNITDITKKTTKDEKGTYLRIKFEGYFNNESDKIENIKTSMSYEQWEELQNLMKIRIVDNDFINEKVLILDYDDLEKTKGTKNTLPRLLVLKGIEGIMNGYPYKYTDVHISVFIKNNIVSKSIFKKDYSIFFKTNKD